MRKVARRSLRRMALGGIALSVGACSVASDPLLPSTPSSTEAREPRYSAGVVPPDSTAAPRGAYVGAGY